MNMTHRSTPSPKINGWVALTSFIVLPFSMIMSGAVFGLLWLWFIVPVFHLPELTLVASMGIQIVINYISYTPEQNDLSWGALYKALVATVSKLLMYLLIGGALHLLFPIK